MNTAQSVRLNKQAHPERYCSNHYCLWKTAKLNHATQTFTLNANPCKRHVFDYKKCRCENNGDYCDYCEPRNEPDLLEATWTDGTVDTSKDDRYSDEDFEHYKAQVK